MHGANGIYANNTIYLDVNAGRYSSSDLENIAIVRTAAHELTHFISDFSPSEYQKIQSFVLSVIDSTGKKTMDDLVREKRERSSAHLSYNQAVEEVVADACEMMLKDSNLMKKFAEADINLAKKISKIPEEIHQRFEGSIFRKSRKNIMKRNSL